MPRLLNTQYLQSRLTKKTQMKYFFKNNVPLPLGIVFWSNANNANHIWRPNALVNNCVLFQSSPTRELKSQPNIPGCLSSEAVKRKGDFVFQTGHVIEIVTKLFLVVQNATGKPPAVNIATQFDANFGTHSVTFQFKVRYLLSSVH